MLCLRVALGKPQAVVSKEQIKEMEAEKVETEEQTKLRTTKSKIDSLPRDLSNADDYNPGDNLNAIQIHLE